MKINHSFFEKLTWVSITLFSFYVSIVVFADNTKPHYYTWLPILPLSYGVINFFSYKIYKNIFNIFNNLAVLLIHILFFVRQSLAIYFLYAGDYASTLNKLTSDNVNKAIILMLYETFCVYLLLNLHKSRRLKINSFKINIRKRTSIKSTNLFKVVGYLLFFLVVFCVFAYTTSPYIRNSYLSIFNGTLLEENRYYSTKVQLQPGTYERAIFSLFTSTLDFVRILFPCWVLFALRKYVGQKMICVVIGLLLCFAQFFMILNENVYILLCVFIIAVFMMKIYPKFRRGIFAFFSVTGVSVFIFLFVWVAKNVSLNTSLSTAMSVMFQGYFPGVSNVACGFNIVDNSKLTTLFFDIYEAIPFHNTLFGLAGDKLSDLFNEVNGVRHYIPPCITQAYHYLGIFAPIVTMLFVKTALGAQKKLNNSDNMFSYLAYALLLLYSSMTPACYSITIFLGHFFSYLNLQGKIIPSIR